MKKGFTIVELAIVLVVIGIILAMAVKGKTLVDTARYRAEINKIRKLEAGVHIWLASNPSIATVRGQGYDRVGEVAMQYMYDKGIFAENDLKSMVVESTAGSGTFAGQTAYWRLMACQYYEDGIGSWASIEGDTGLNMGLGSFAGGNFCAQLTLGVDKRENGFDVWWVNMPMRLQCFTELLMDDENRTSGAARYDVMYSHNDESGMDYKNCMSLSMNEPTDSNLFYVLY